MMQAAHHARRDAAGATTKNHNIRRGDEGQGQGGGQREGQDDQGWGARLLLART